MSSYDQSTCDHSNLDDQSVLVAVQAQLDDIEGLDASSDADASRQIYATELERVKGIISDSITAQNLANDNIPDKTDGKSSSGYDRTTMLQCEVCSEEKESGAIYQLHCDHLYCSVCLQRLAEASMTDESLFPPRCCRKPIPIERISASLTPDIVERFNVRKLEMETPNRIYCSSRECSSFIHPHNVVADLATCQKCGIVTCAICKAESHAGDCPSDPAIQNLRQLSSEKGWQSCYNCHRVIELTMGCNHITYDPQSLADNITILTWKKSCYCRAEFCYHCGQKWQTCFCEIWEEENLVLRAAQIVDLDNGIDIGAQERARRIAVAVEFLRQNPHCEHDAWDQINGPHKCDECSYRMPKFRFQCRQCGVQFCQRCRRNRL